MIDLGNIAYKHETFWVFQQDGKLEIKDFGGWQTRHRSSIRLFTKALSIANIKNDFLFMVNTGDLPVAPSSENRPYKIFSSSSMDGYDDIAIPDFIFDGWPQIGVDDFTQTMEAIEEAGRQPFFDPRLFWIGYLNSKSRKAFIHLARDNSSVIHGVDHSWPPLDEEGHPTSDKSVSLPNHCRYRYLIDLPSGPNNLSYSGRVKMLMYSLRPLFLVDRPSKEFFYPWLRPFEHFIPVKTDLSDLFGRIKWADDNPDKCKEIAEAALAFAHQFLTREAAIGFLAKCLSDNLKEPTC